MKDQKPEIMNDGTEAWLTHSRSYYCRREPDVRKWTKIVYYGLNKEHIPLAKAQCEKCLDIIESQHCGDYVTCGCGLAYVDTDRWMPEMHRYGGRVKILISYPKKHEE